MKDSFHKLYDYIMEGYKAIVIADINDVICKSENILYEVNEILRRPDNLFNKVKSVVLESIKSKSNDLIRIGIKEAISDCSSVNDQDSSLLATLNELFKDHSTAYFNVVVDPNDGIRFSDEKGSFKPPSEFHEMPPIDELHYSYPRIQVLAPKDEDTKVKLKTLKNKLDGIKSLYDRKRKAIEYFKDNILSFDDFGTIVIYSTACTTDDANVDMPTIDEVIEHECQHLCIFLMSIAKTCAYYRTSLLKLCI